MNDSQSPNTGKPDGVVWTISFDAKVAGDWMRRILYQVHTECGNCSDCRKGWERLTNGYAAFVTSIIAIRDNHAEHSPTTTAEDGTELGIQ